MFQIDKKTLNELKAMEDMMKTIAAMGATVKSAVLKAREHANQYPDVKKNPGLNNAEILKHMADQGRDFITPTDAQVTKIAQAFVDEAARRLNRDAAQASKVGHKSPKSRANLIAGAGFRVAGMVWMKVAHDRILNEGWIASDSKMGKKQLHPQYATKKMEDVGFLHPIGTRSGQVEENLKPDKKNIKVES